jgi:valyl-tRNA synthetase
LPRRGRTDTWFSSALWLFSTLGWSETTGALSRFTPAASWSRADIPSVARMMMMGLKFMGDVPFRDVYITGLIRDEHGDKMSKSGQRDRPADIVDGISLETYRTHRGLDAAAARPRDRAGDAPAVSARHRAARRPTRCALPSPPSPPSRDIRFDLGRVAGYRNFGNKL